MNLKESVSLVQKKGIFHLLDKDNKVKRQKPWLGDIFSVFYDRIMEKSVFPKKFSGSMSNHYEILKHEFRDIKNQNILELACGSGDGVLFLNRDNYYTGIDISKGLLNIAKKKFIKNGFLKAELVVADACDLPFRDDCFDMGICNLSLNFFTDLEKFISELQRVLKPGALFYCSVPVPEKKNPRVRIHGNLFTSEELRNKFLKHNFEFEVLPYENGALIYFKARIMKD